MKQNKELTDRIIADIKQRCVVSHIKYAKSLRKGVKQISIKLNK